MLRREGNAIKVFKCTAIIILLLLAFSSTFPWDVPYIAPVSPDLGPGSAGEAVMDLQQRLKNWGYYYSGDVSGFYDEDTKEAVKKYQEVKGLNPDGIAGEETLMAMGMGHVIRSFSAYAQNSSRISDEQLLARAINGEARGEPYEGQVAVGAVIINRTKDPKFPKTIAGVIYQPGAFTAVSDGQINVPIDPKSTVVKAARDALNGWDPTNGCIYYWNPATATSKWIWSRKIVKKIGKHYFGK